MNERRFTTGSLRLILVSAIVLFLGGIAGHIVAQRLPTANKANIPATNENLQATSGYGTQFAATVQAMDIPLIDDPLAFSPSQSSSDRFAISNTEQGLLITNRIPERNRTVMTVTGHDLPADVDVSVTVQGLTSTCDDWVISLRIRQQLNGPEIGDAYVLYVKPDDNWGFLHDFPGYFAPRLADGTLEPDFDIFQPNTLRVEAKGNEYTLYINGEPVGTATDSDPVREHNDIGLGVHLLCSGEASALFSNLLVKAP